MPGASEKRLRIRGRCDGGRICPAIDVIIQKADEVLREVEAALEATLINATEPLSMARSRATAADCVGVAAMLQQRRGRAAEDAGEEAAEGAHDGGGHGWSAGRELICPVH